MAGIFRLYCDCTLCNAYADVRFSYAIQSSFVPGMEGSVESLLHQEYRQCPAECCHVCAFWLSASVTMETLQEMVCGNSLWLWFFAVHRTDPASDPQGCVRCGRPVLQYTGCCHWIFSDYGGAGNLRREEMETDFDLR